MNKIRIGIGVASVGRFLPYIGEEAGLFGKAGISVEISNQKDEEKVVLDIASGETPIGTPNAPSLLFSVLDGEDLVIIGGILNRPGFYLVGRPGVHEVADLNGKRVGINQPRRMAGVVMLALLRQWGFDPQKDLTLVELGLNDKSQEALQQGELDAALLPPEKAFLAEEQGSTIVADSSSLNCHWVPLATTRKFLQSNREVVEAVARIYRDSIRIFQSEPERAVHVVRGYLPGLAAKPHVVERVCRFFASQFEPTLVPDANSLEAMLGEIARQDPRAGDIPLASLTADLLSNGTNT